MSYADLKQRRKGGIDRLVAAAGGDKKNYNDPNEWKLTKDENGTGAAVIRFLPESEGSELPWVQYWDHFFKGPTGQWYVEKSLTTLGQPDPVFESNGRLYNSGLDSNKELAGKRKRKLNYVSNVMIISDPANPENEGKVLWFKYGKKIHDKIMRAVKPEFDDQKPVDVFDFIDGANFRIRVTKGDGGWPNYDASQFDPPSPLSESDEQLEAVYNKLHDLRQFVDPSTFKSYEELKSRLATVLGTPSDGGTQTMDQMEMVGSETPPWSEREEKPVAVHREESPPEVNSTSEFDDDDDDIMKKFARMAQENS